jgi:hypothetical protein
MVTQLRDRGYTNIMILDQASNYKPQLVLLDEMEEYATVVRLGHNYGPHWFFTSGLALKFPQWFVYTDPDIYFTDAIGSLFLDDMVTISTDLGAAKLGLALDIGKPEAMLAVSMAVGGREYSISEWEKQFWMKRMVSKTHVIYEAPVDTTFALYNRAVFDIYMQRFQDSRVFDCMSTPKSYRLAGDFTAIHMPWMKDDPIPREELEFYCSNMKKIHDY